MMPCSAVFHGTKGEIAAREPQDQKDGLYWKQITCPKCGSSNVEFTMDVPINFTLSESGQVQVTSKNSDITRIIDHELGECDNLSCECLDCCWDWCSWND